MTNAIQTHRETALESPYSRDRREAIAELERLFPDTDVDAKRRILETLREVAHDATSTQERDLAREAMVEAFESDPETAGAVVVPAFCDLAANASHKDERLDAIDALRECYPDVDEPEQERIGQCLAEVAGNATYEDERRRAQRRLSDVTAENQRASADDGDDGDAIGYLGQSLAEHLASAAAESPEACQQRAEEVQEFVENNPVDDEEYEKVRASVDELAEQLAVVPTDGELDDDRKERVRGVANRVERLYTRGGS
jgi:hypothetical protein